MWRRGAAAAAFVALLVAVVAASAQVTSSLTGVRVGQHDGMTRLILDLTEPTTFKIFALSGPPRVVIDLPALHWAMEERSFVVGHSGVVRLRYGQFRPDTSRIVVDLDQPLAVRQARDASQPTRRARPPIGWSWISSRFRCLRSRLPPDLRSRSCEPNQPLRPGPCRCRS